MVSNSKPSNKYDEQHLLMAALPFLLLNAKQHFKNPPTKYIMSSGTEEISSPPSRLDMPESEDLLKLLKIDNIDLANLVPKIEFYKIIRSPDGKIKEEIFIPYSYDGRNYAENIYGNARQRGDDIGIQSVSFVYDEQNPAVAESLLGCKIDFVFGNAAALVVERVYGQNKTFRYADLFAFKDTSSSEAIDRDKYDIVLKVGYQVDGHAPTFDTEIRNILKKHERVLVLGMVGYDLSFEPNGMLKVSVDYKSSNINYFSDKRNDIFATPRKTKKMPLFGGPMPIVGEKTPAQPPQEPEDSAQEAPEDTKPAIDKQKLMSSAFEWMTNFGKIRTFNAELVDKISEGNYYFSTNRCSPSDNNADFKKDLGDQASNVPSMTLDDIFASLTGGATYQGDERDISYFYFGDLIEAILSVNPEIFDRMKARKFSFLFDNVAYQFIKGKQVSVFNLAKLPIAVSFYNQWFTKTKLEKDVKTMPLMSFVKDYVIQFGFAALRRKTFDEIGLDYYPMLVRRLVNVPEGLSDNKESFGSTKLSPVKGKSYYAKNASSHHEYYILYDEQYYSDSLSYESQLINDEDRYYYNLASGIPHFYIGSDRGLLKTFSFQKSNIGEGLAVVRNLEQGTPTQQLWTIFDLNAEFVGNNLMSVGKNIYLDPTITGLGNPMQKGTVSNIMGLGGYYMVSRVEHNYYPVWRTNITAIMIAPASQKTNYSSKSAEFTYF
tara:strand:+ start:2025 stop:4172 length:2148 start_codon:yes stop_codon:yes gene_type:complete